MRLGKAVIIPHNWPLDTTIQTSQQFNIFKYWDTGVKIGKGKNGPVDLILVGNNQLRALKRITKASIQSQKRAQYILNEKKILMMF